MEKRLVYADNAGTTAMSPAALDAMMPYLGVSSGNPSAIYSLGREAKRAVEKARETVARAIGADTNEIYFTGCGTESNNWAIRGSLEMPASKGRNEVVTSAIEHHAITHCLAYLEKQGTKPVYLPVDAVGQVSPDALREAITDKTALVSVMTANNEIGTVLPVRELAAIAHERGTLFHTDAVQAVGHIPVNVKDLGCDMLSLSAHKFRGPKGVGAMYIRKGLRLPAFIHGGGQERSARSGTENVAGIVGLAAALSESVRDLEENTKRVTAMRDRLITELLKIPASRLTGDPVNRLPGTASFVFECVEGEAMVLSLDNLGISASSGSACSSGSLDPSHVLMAIGLPHEVAHGSLRLTLNECNTDADVDYILEKLPAVIEKLRAMSPLWESR